MFLLELEDESRLIDESALTPDYWWLLDHPGLLVSDLFRFVCGRGLREFHYDRNARETAAAALKLLEYMDRETEEDERDGLEMRIGAPESWFEPGDFLPLARAFVDFLMARPACTDEPVFETYSQYQIDQYADARPAVLSVYKLLIDLLEDALERGVRFRFTGPKGQAELDRYWQRSRELSKAWWDGPRNR